jgi:hypothetical protein
VGEKLETVSKAYLSLYHGGMIDDNAHKLTNIGNSDNENIYIKQDGSLDDGFEIVSHPMSLDYHTRKMPWKDVLQKAISMNYRSHKTTTCGYHLHIGRDGLGDDYDTQETTISNILYFTEKHWDEMLRFSRRSEAQINRWASRYGYKDTPKQ